MSEQKKKLMWYNVALIGFAGVWGFGNVVQNYSQQGVNVIVSWIFIMFLYFLPYVLMTAELGSVFSNSKAGVSSWIRETSGAKIAYFAAWTYWVVHIPYIAQKPMKGVIAMSWFFTLDPNYIDKFGTIPLQLFYIAIFLAFVALAYFGLKSIKVLGSIAGTAMFIMSMLYILLGISAIIFGDVNFATADLSFEAIMPTINFQYLTTLSLLVLAVGGIEKMSPYVGETENASRNFPKAMIAILIMVMISAIFGTVAMAAMFDSANIPSDLLTNGEYYAFDMLGEWYGAGHIFTRIYALANAAAQFTALLLAIDAPLKMLLMESDKKYVPKGLTKTNKYGAPYVGYMMMIVLVVIILILPMFSTGGDTNAIYTWITKLNGVVMPLRYLWVFVAYFLLKRYMDQKSITPDYTFVKTKTTGQVIAIWCFVFTAVSCIFGMVPSSDVAVTIIDRIAENPAVFSINLMTPIVLIVLGLILPYIAKRAK